MNHLLTQESWHTLVLADGCRWEIFAGDEKAASIVSELGCAMQLPMTTDVIEPLHHGNLCRLLVQVDTQTSEPDCHISLASKNCGSVVCILSPCENRGGLYFHFLRLSLIFAREAQARGGVLIHGALAERDGLGVILTAPGGTGKTTASNRLPAPWRSRCDDTTLVVRDLQGNYWAHPWPTWSRLLEEGPGGCTWDVQSAVPVKAIFFLAQAVEDRVERIGPGHAVSLLLECVGQASTLMASGLREKELRALHMERFDNLSSIGPGRTRTHASHQPDRCLLARD